MGRQGSITGDISRIALNVHGEADHDGAIPAGGHLDEGTAHDGGELSGFLGAPGALGDGGEDGGEVGVPAALDLLEDAFAHHVGVGVATEDEDGAGVDVGGGDADDGVAGAGADGGVDGEGFPGRAEVAVGEVDGGHLLADLNDLDLIAALAKGVNEAEATMAGDAGDIGDAFTDEAIDDDLSACHLSHASLLSFPFLRVGPSITGRRSTVRISRGLCPCRCRRPT